MDYKHLRYYTRKDEDGSMTSPNGKRIVFISHRRADNDGYLEKIVTEILDYADCAVWYDLEGLTGGYNYNQEIHSAIISADAMLLLVSPTSFQSDYIWEIEVPTAKENGIPIIPIIINNPNAMEMVEQRLEDSIQCLDYYSDDFHEKFIKSLEAFVINAEEENRIKQIFLKGQHNDPASLYLEDKLLMAKGYHKGIGTDKNPALAERWLNLIGYTDLELYGERCKPVVIDALSELMVLYRPVGNSKYRSAEKYEQAAMHAAQLGCGSAAADVAVIYRRGKGGIPRDINKAIEWYTYAANANDNRAMIALANIYRDGSDGIQQNSDKAIEWYTKAAEAGNTNAMITLGKLYKDGTTEIAKDESAAVKWYTCAANSGNINAMMTLGKIYRNGMYGMEKNGVKAVEWYKRAADTGNTNAMIALGNIYQNGIECIDCDVQQTVYWYTRAVDAQNTNAMIAMASLYKNGMPGMARDGEKAIEWYTRAADAGNMSAKVMLGKIYKDGMLEVDPNLNMATELFTQANAVYLLEQTAKIKSDRALMDDIDDEQDESEKSTAVAAEQIIPIVNEPEKTDDTKSTDLPVNEIDDLQKSKIWLPVLIITLVLAIVTAAVFFIYPDLLDIIFNHIQLT